MNLERLREFAQGLPQPAELPDPVVSNERMLEEQRGGAEPDATLNGAKTVVI